MTETALFADVDGRTIRGLLLPFNELSSPSVSNTAPVMFAPGTVDLPADASVVMANEGHSQFQIRGHATTLTETPAGIVAEFAIASTPEGDALLAAAANPDVTKRPKLSAELRDLVREGARAIKSTLTGGAFVPQGAFKSAALFALADEITEELEVDAIDIAAIVREAVADALKNTEDSPSEEDKKDDSMTAAAAVLPDGLTPPAGENKDTTSATGLFAAIAQAKHHGDHSALSAYGAGEAMFAISTVQHSGPTSLTIGADIQVPQFIGQLWARKAYERKFWPLFNQGTLTSYKVNGWKFAEGKEPAVAAYAGNTAEIPSNVVDTEPVSADARRIAGGHRIDRRFTDFSDQGFWDAYFSAMTESYARVSDLDALSVAVAQATAVVPGTVPAGTAKGLAAIIDGALAVIAQENAPSFAVVSPELWRDIALTGRDEVLGYLNASFGLEEGSTAGFKIIPGPVGVGKVLVGAREARTVYELGGSPIRVEGIVPGNGAIDPALYGYIADVTHNAKALALVTIAA